MSIWEGLWAGLGQALSWPAFGLMLLTIPIGLVIGIIPGLGGNLGLALLIPFKISIMEVFRQYGVNFTALKPHTVKPGTDRFKANIDQFDRVCRVVAGVKGMVVGAIGARTTPFKTVRIDEVALQRHGITVETFDLSDIFLRMKAVKPETTAYVEKSRLLREYSSWDGVPDRAFENIVRLGVTLDQLAQEAKLDALAIRCWTEMQMQMGISPCVAMGVLNDIGTASAARWTPAMRWR